MTQESFLVLEMGRCVRLVAEGQQGHLLKLMCREESNRHGKKERLFRTKISRFVARDADIILWQIRYCLEMWPLWREIWWCLFQNYSGVSQYVNIDAIDFSLS